MANFLGDDSDDLREALLAELKPKGPIEMSVFDQIAHSAWMLQQLSAIELPLEPGADKAYVKLERTRDRHRRMYDQSLASLRRLQTERAVQSGRDLRSAREEAPLADPQRIERALRRSRTRRPVLDLAKIPPVTDVIQ